MDEREGSREVYAKSVSFWGLVGITDGVGEAPPRWPFALQAMQWVAIETPTPEACASLYFVVSSLLTAKKDATHKMEKGLYHCFKILE